MIMHEAFIIRVKSANGTTASRLSTPGQLICFRAFEKNCQKQNWY